jgi:hypothetical protein
MYNRGKSDKSVCIATGYGLDGRGSIPSRGKKLFSSEQPPTQWVPGTISLGIK